MEIRPESVAGIRSIVGAGQPRPGTMKAVPALLPCWLTNSRFMEEPYHGENEKFRKVIL
jgi:hypothetical protein